MPSPADAYREGYERGRNDTLGERLFEIMTVGLSRDDPSGFFAAGYYDGAGGKQFNPHGRGEGKSRSNAQAAPTSRASLLERQWWVLCDASEFIPKETVDQYMKALYAQGSQVGAIIGLSTFTEHTCPRCAKSGHSRVHFLGALKHPGCGWDGYMKSGSYIGHQVAQVFHTGVRAGGAMKEEADKKPDNTGNWMYAIFGFLFVAMFRAIAALVLIPLHCILALMQPKQTQGEVITRVVTLVVMLVGIIILIYNVH